MIGLPFLPNQHNASVNLSMNSDVLPMALQMTEMDNRKDQSSDNCCMSTIVSCKEHDHSKHDIYDICETNEGSEAPVGQAHALLRKDRRPDSILNILTDYIPQITPEQNSKDPAWGAGI
ncbi:uncharacterized protein LACBIDRAFT_293611 [Laccaria bicolor S238N-H82]|uniref:Predicted protein n=1 Tax=Laccaria bicolor (strain S238N-H82 / ATCC MYA-4686) TaxID=486041 RepID=B0D4L1_LACBS|nr:uncharacterized protein LACBIDRAFT_293611 [Laccaria bicolor S238N-H82]EDR10364.1 predicted protein [Laccaria bicolor S238N-H82]|eukprot:XP_001878814.1 predicted protein [Laccaria bicolor S238N-H82]